MSKLETTTIDLDADVAERNKNSRRRALNVVRIPALRLIGFSFVLVFVLLYNFFVTGSVAWSTIGALGVVFATYCWLSWISLYLWFDRAKPVDLGFVFLAVDMVLWTAAIYCCGAENSWLLFFLVVRSADQATTGFRRVLFFAHFAVVCYIGLLLYVHVVDGHALNLPAEAVKLVVLYGAGIYISLTARAAEEIRERTRAAMHLARNLIAQLKRKESELSESEIRYRNLFENSPVGIYRTRPDGQIILANPALLRMLGYPSFEELAAKSLEAEPPESSYPRSEFRARLERDGEIRGLESVWTRRDGTHIYVSENTRAVRDERNRVAFYEGTIEDISVRKDAEMAMRDARDAAEAAARAKSEFLANMSHEIRTPMNAIIGMTSLLLGMDLSDEQRDYVETVRQSGDSLLATVNDVLDFSKIDAGKLDLERQPFDLRDCVEDCIDLVAAQAAVKRLELVYAVADDTPHTLIGDVTRLRQIIANLLSNAVKFTESGEIAVHVDSRAIGSNTQVVRFAVRDTGLGVPAERLDTLFDSFTQVDASTTRRFGGTGLGLAISKRLAELMGGIMWAESEVGRGSTFSFTIMVEAANGAPPEHLSSARRELVGRRLLVVDDNQTSCHALVSHVRRWGVVATAVASGREAIERLERGEPFDAMLVDAEMPDVSGAELADRVRKVPSASSVKIIELATRGVRRSAPSDRSRFDVTISKPVRAAALHASLLTVFGGDAPTERTTTAGGASTGIGSLGPLTILLVEDNAVNQKVASRMLAKLGYRSDVAADGLEAVEAVSRQRYDVVFMDIQMPEMDGLAATRWIRSSIPANVQPRIIAMTANAIKGDREACLAAGMDDYVTKPVRLKDLIDALTRVVTPRAPDVPAEDTLDPARLVELKQLDAGGDPSVTAEIVSTYLRLAPESIDEMRRAVRDDDAAALERAAHRLRGSSANIGARHMAELCARVERGARDGAVSTTEPDLALIEQHLPVLRSAFEAWQAAT